MDDCVEEPGVVFGAASTKQLPDVGDEDRKTPQDYLDYYMNESSEADINKRASEMIQRYNELHREFQKRFPEAAGASAAHSHVPAELHFLRDRHSQHPHFGAHEESGDKYLELFRLAEEFCLLLIPIGYHAFHTESALTADTKNTLRKVYMDGLTYKLNLMNSEGIQPILEYARREYGLMAM